MTNLEDTGNYDWIEMFEMCVLSNYARVLGAIRGWFDQIWEYWTSSVFKPKYCLEKLSKMALEPESEVRVAKMALEPESGTRATKLALESESDARVAKKALEPESGVQANVWQRKM